MSLKSILLLAIAGISGLALVNPVTPDDKKIAGVDISAIDKTINPRTDFYLFANGAWLKNNPIPETESHWGGFNEVEEKTNSLLREIMKESMDPKRKRTEAEIMLGKFYTAAMDSVQREKSGIAPVKPLLDKVSMVRNSEELARLTGELHSYGITPFFSSIVMPDARESSMYSLYFWQGGLGLPDKDYYFNDDDNSVHIREAYLDHLRKTFGLIGYKPEAAAVAAENVMQVEKQLAGASRSKTELRDMSRMYNRFPKSELAKTGEGFKWDFYFPAAKLEHKDDVILGQPEYFNQVSKIAGDNRQMGAVRDYLRWHIIKETSSKLNHALEEQNFAFYGREVYGIKSQKPRWKRVIAVSNEVIPDLVGQLYVKKAIPEGTRERVNEMVNYITEAFRNRITGLDWMTPETRNRAIEKLEAVSRKLAFPDVWKNYDDLDLSSGAYATNYLNALHLEYMRQAAKVGQGVDRQEWAMAPQTVNAYYNPLQNEIVFPAAIMQPPFYYPTADDAVNYGSMGAVIGHELTHGFDDQGSMFNATGNMENWWNPDDMDQFRRKSRDLISQFSRYKVDDNNHVNGELTLGENIADLGGLSIAYDALQMSYRTREKKIIDGYTPEQRFFIGFAQVWRDNARPEFLSTLVRTDPHSPSRFRVEGTLSNMPAFYEAFNIQPGDPLYKEPSERISIW